MYFPFLELPVSKPLIPLDVRVQAERRSGTFDGSGFRLGACAAGIEGASGGCNPRKAGERSAVILPVNTRLRTE